MISFNINGTPIHTAAEFGSNALDHRSKLREALSTWVQNFIISNDNRDSFADLTTLSDLSKPPRLDGWAISVSHCPSLGGFIAAPSNSHVGLDFELTARVSSQIAHRVAAFPGETKLLEQIGAAEKPLAIFWAAKEAAIKAFGNSDPLSSPHFGIVEILDIDPEHATFTAAHLDRRACGYFFDVNSEIVGAFAETARMSKS